MKSPNQELLYLELWKTEKHNNDKAKEESFKKSQENEEVLKEQYNKDISEIELKNPSSKNSIVVKCINCIAHN